MSVNMSGDDYEVGVFITPLGPAIIREKRYSPIGEEVEITMSDYTNHNCIFEVMSIDLPFLAVRQIYPKSSPTALFSFGLVEEPRGNGSDTKILDIRNCSFKRLSKGFVASLQKTAKTNPADSNHILSSPKVSFIEFGKKEG